MYTKRLRDLRELDCQKWLGVHLSSLFQQCNSTWYVIDAGSFRYDCSLIVASLIFQQSPPEAVPILLLVLRVIALDHVIYPVCYSNQKIDPQKFDLPFGPHQDSLDHSVESNWN